MAFTTARFYVAEVHEYPGIREGYAEPAPRGKVILRPSMKGEGNKPWASATPSGEISMVIRGEALTAFQERLRNGTDIHITFEDVPAEPPAE